MRSPRKPLRLVAFALATASVPAGAQPVVPVRTLVEELRIGSESDARYTLSPDLRLAVGTDGSMFVLLPMEQVVRVYDPRGRFVRHFGGRGAGPGEFESPAYLGWLGDTLWVSDPMRLRATLFRTDGRVTSTLHMSVRPTRTYGASSPSALLSDGSALVTLVVPAELAATGAVSRAPVIRVLRDGSVADTLLWRSVRNQSLRVALEDRRRFFLPQPWDDSPLLESAPDGTGFVTVDREAATGREAYFTVTRFRADGEIVYRRTFGYVPEAIPRGWADGFIREHAEALAELRPGTPVGVMERELSRGLFVPRYKPPVSAVVFGSDGTVWLRREHGESTSVTWQVLDRDGRMEANVAVPRRLTVLVAKRQRVWGTLTDENDAPSLVRYSVRTTPRR